ncbi:beta-ketoacyl synthase N-terminal-like domain-containing protein [Halioxenophilus sp. WMMB6]|uniref:beta-ketoacyl synthase N-terminal-like domain-containing protein n=1 Tax=Halioxenophilus sp. WMMB6 TaxID=3073815 RepID=UPI00295F3290|nr:beta-ketoacyl synthase N-terminal-like domain-containing protein [Halioxenophilus sp. WMMB6]
MTLFPQGFSQRQANNAGAVKFLGAGACSALGADVANCLAQLRSPPAAATAIPVTLAGETLAIPYKPLVTPGKAEATAHTAPPERIFTLCQQVANQAIAEAGLTAEQRCRMGLFLGSSSFDIAISEAQYRTELAAGQAAVAMREPSFGRLADQLRQQMGLTGPDFSFNTACTASANALIAAIAQVQAGLLEHALVMGVELYNDITALGFHGLGLLTQSVMRPFDPARDGLVLGEGVAALVVGRSKRPGGFYLRGSASLCDTYGISSAAPDGSTIALVMQQALADAGLSARQISAIKAHGTASLSNDEAEAAGMHQLFAQLPPVAAIKPHLGHTLGACGLLELVLFYRALEAGFLIATPAISEQPGDLNITLNQVNQAMAAGHFMLNFFGFGGNNCSLVISNDGGVAA